MPPKHDVINTEQDKGGNANQTSYIYEVRQALKSKDAVEKVSLDPPKEAQIKDQTTDTGLKKLYAWSFIGILIGQLLSMNIIFIAVGLDYLKFNDPWYLKLFMSGTLAEVFGIVFVITRYLFPPKK